MATKLFFSTIFFLLLLSPTLASSPMLNNATAVSKVIVNPSDLVQMVYHMGPVMSPDITVHIIWYGSWLPSHKRIIREFINSFSAASHRSPSVSEWWKTLQLYTDQTDSNVSRRVLLGKEKNDRLMSQGRSLSRLSIQSVIRAAITAKTNPLPTDTKGGLYLVLTAEDILVQDFCREVCGFHYFTYSSIVGYTLQYAWVGNSAKMCPGLCAYPFAVPVFMPGAKPKKSPNGVPGVDGMISVIAHEIAEIATNPLINAWYVGDDPISPVEVADLCQGIYGIGGIGPYIGKVRRDKYGAVYNLHGIRRRFLVQWVWNHVEQRCTGPNN